MNKHVIFIHGGGDGGYGPDAKLVASLRTELGETYKVHYPQMPSEIGNKGLNYTRTLPIKYRKTFPFSFTIARMTK